MPPNNKPPKGKLKLHRTTQYPPGECTLLAKIVKACKKLRIDFHKVLKEADILVPDRTLRRWIVTLDATGDALSNDKQSGHKRSLSEEQMKILAGFVMHENDQNIDVNLSLVVEFVKFAFNIEVVTHTAGNYLRELGFSLKTSQTKTGGFQLSNEGLAELYVDFTEAVVKL